MTEADSSIFRGFPSDEHVDRVCKPGQEGACRYLSMAGTTEICERYSRSGEYINQCIEDGTFRATGDNCQGIVTLLEAHSDLLIGNRVTMRESCPDWLEEGTLESIAVDGRNICFSARTKSGELYEAPFKLDDTEISATREGIVANVRGLSAFAGEWLIAFRDVERQEEVAREALKACPNLWQRITRRLLGLGS